MRRTQVELFVALIAALTALRDPDVWRIPHFFAEDGTIFFEQQVLLGLPAIFVPYNGYLNVLPRMGAELAAMFPVSWGPFVYGWIGMLVSTLCLCYFLLPENRIFVRSDVLRAAVCLVLASDFRVRYLVCNLLHLQWYVMPVALLMVAQCAWADDAALRGRLPFYLPALVLIGLTSPVLLFFFPVIVFLLWRKPRGSPARVILFFFAAALLAQAGVWAYTHDRIGSPPPYPPFPQSVYQAMGAICTSWCYRVLVTSLAGHDLALRLSLEFPLAWPVVAVLLNVALLFLLRKRVGRSHFLPMLAGFFAGLLLMIGPLVVRNTLAWYGRRGELQAFDETPRFYFLPCWILVISTAIVLDRVLTRRRAWQKALVLLAVFSLGIIQNFSIPDAATHDWGSAASKIEDWETARKRGASANGVSIPIDPPPWSVTLPPLKGADYSAQ